MDTDEKIHKLVGKLLAGSEEGSLGWQATMDENSFRLVSKLANLTINKEEIFHPEAEEHFTSRSLTITNDKGRIVEEYRPEGATDEDRFDRLFKMARRSAYKTDELIEGLIQFIDASEAF